MIRMNKDIRYCDILVIFIVAFLIAVRFFTISILFNISEITSTDIEKVTKVYEANPLLKLSLNFQSILMIVVVPALAITTYLLFRKRAINGRMDTELLVYYTNFFFFVMLFDVINDLAHYLATL